MYFDDPSLATILYLRNEQVPLYREEMREIDDSSRVTLPDAESPDPDALDLPPDPPCSRACSA